MIRVSHGVDGFHAIQESLCLNDMGVQIRFGPLSSSLEELYDRGFRLECRGYRRPMSSPAKEQIELVGRRLNTVSSNSRPSWRIGKIFYSSLLEVETLVPFINGKNLYPLSQTTMIHEFLPAIKSNIEKLEELADYHQKRTNSVDGMVGNQTFDEWLVNRV